MSDGLFFNNSSWAEMYNLLDSNSVTGFNDISIFAQGGSEITDANIQASHDIIPEVGLGGTVLDNVNLFAGNNITMSAQELHLYGDFSDTTAGNNIVFNTTNQQNDLVLVANNSDKIESGSITLTNTSVDITLTSITGQSPSIPEPVSTIFMGIFAVAVCLSRLENS